MSVQSSEPYNTGYSDGQNARREYSRRLCHEMGLVDPPISAKSDAREGMVPFDMPKLMPTTAKLVLDFAKALADKLAAAEVKYGYGDSWATPDDEDWPHPKCFTDLVKHLQKGDPRDVAIYCAFLWYHGLSTSKCIEMAGMVPAVELRPLLVDLCQWIKRRLQILEYEDTSTRNPSTGGVSPNGFAYSPVPEWELRQKLEAIETLLGEKGGK